MDYDRNSRSVVDRVRSVESPLATKNLLENTDGVPPPHECSLGVAPCCLLYMLTAALLIGIGTALLATRRCGGESAIRCCCVGSLGTRRSKASVVANTIRTRAGRINGVNPADAVEALKLQRVWGVHRFRLAFAEQQQQHARHTTRPAVLGQFSVRRRQRVRTIVSVSLWSTTAARIEMWSRHPVL